MTPIQASPEDIAIWGRSLRSYEGAVGSGHPFPEAQLAGHLYAAIPITAPQVILLWETVGASKTHPQSAWHQLPNFSEFGLGMRAQRYKTGWFSKTPWYCEFSVILGKGGLEVRGFHLTSGDTLTKLFDQADMMLRGDCPPRASSPQ